MRVRLALVLLAACSNTWRPETSSTGWHACDYAGTRGCPEWYVCVRDGCEFFGDPNGPGPGDTTADSDPPGR